MKVLQINTVFRNGGSTGRIVYDLMCAQSEAGIDAFVAYGYRTWKGDCPNSICLQGYWRRKINILRTRLFDHHGFYNERETRRLIEYMEFVQPDIIHLHNIHNHFVNVKMLFGYIKEKGIPVVWTLHDCWPFTGHCAYFDYSGCDKWKKGCGDCPSLRDYPPTWFFDRTEKNFLEKKAVFSGVENMIMVSPSKWLATLLRDSFLKDYESIVINNGVDLGVFSPEKDAKEKLGFGKKRVLLALSNGYMKRKGVEYLKKMIPLLNDDELLVIVGVSEAEFGYRSDERCQVISHTDNVQQLVSFYSAADVFINPTLEDNFPTTNLESLACGTPVVTFETGGSAESVSPLTGLVVERGNLDALLNAARQIISDGKKTYTDECVRTAHENYDKNKQYRKYIELYKKILNHES